MATYQIIEIFGKRIRIVEDEEGEVACKKCALFDYCEFGVNVCQDAKGNQWRHFELAE